MRGKLPLIISFYTSDGDYPDKAHRLRKQCEEFGLDYYIARLPSRNDYAANCSMKPAFILSCLNNFNRPVLWLDADTEIKGIPELLRSLTCDIAAVPVQDPHNKLRWYVGVLYFANSEVSRKILCQWHGFQGETGDHYPFYHTVISTGVGVHELPIEYGRMGDGDCVFALELSRNQIKSDFYRRFKGGRLCKISTPD